MDGDHGPQCVECLRRVGIRVDSGHSQKATHQAGGILGCAVRFHRLAIIEIVIALAAEVVSAARVDMLAHCCPNTQDRVGIQRGPSRHGGGLQGVHGDGGRHRTHVGARRKHVSLMGVAAADFLGVALLVRWVCLALG